jgi:hypothetical protein
VEKKGSSDFFIFQRFSSFLDRIEGCFERSAPPRCTPAYGTLARKKAQEASTHALYTPPAAQLH